jgi:glycosyltransferase involved in cell wall biosynthesis
MTAENPVVWFPSVKVGTGTDRFTERLAAALEKRGIKSVITWLPRRAEYAPWTVPIPRRPAGVNLVHVNSWMHQRFIPKELPLVVTIHSCVHDSALESYKNLPQIIYHRFWVKRCERYSISHANTVTAVSHYTAKCAETLFKRIDIVRIYNWIDTTTFQSVEKENPSCPFRLLFVGNLKRLKGADLLPEIMRRLGSDFELYYTGSESQFDGVSSLPSNMIPFGYIDDITELVDLYQKSDALLFPTRVEGFGLVALEAQACGCPVISTDGSSLPEVVADGKTGILCPQNDIDSFVDAANKLCNNRQIWRKMRIQGRLNAVRIFNEKVAIDQYLALYRQILSSI